MRVTTNGAAPFVRPMSFVTLGAMPSASRDDHARLTDRERGLTWLLAAAFVALTTALYSRARAAAIDASEFTGTFVFDQDAHFYMGMARQAMEGRWLFSMPFTPEAHEPAVFNFEWLAMGWLARLTGGDVIDGMHLVRLIGMVVLVVGVVRLCALVFATTRWRLGVAVAILTGGGFGWTLGYPSIAQHLSDFTFLDSYAGVHPFFWMLFQPHFVIAQALLVTCLGTYLRAAQRPPGARRTRGFVFAFIGAAMVTLMRPYDGVVLALAGALFALSRRWSANASTGLGEWSLTLGALPLIVHQHVLFSEHEVFGWISRQGILLPPEPGNLVMSLGLPALVLPIALAKYIGAPALQRDTRGALAVQGVLCTLVAALALLYAYPPFPFTLQVIPAVAIPLTLFALAPFERRAELRSGRLATLVVVLVLGLHALTSASFYLAKWEAIPRGAHRIDTALVDAYEWVGDNVAADSVVMASYKTSNRLPRYALVRTFAGHSFATVAFKRKVQLAELFFLPLVDDAFRQHLIEEYGITHVVHGPDEEAYGSWDPRGKPWLEQLYRRRGVSVFAVRE